MKKLIIAVVMVFAVAALLMVTATPSEAVHAASGELTCGQCHTMHSSQGDSSGSGDMGSADGSSLLLRIGGSKTISDLCLSCHAQDGSGGNTLYNSNEWETKPPKVLLTGGNWVSDFKLIGAGGDFSRLLSDTSGGSGGLYTTQGPDGNGPGYASLGYGHSINNTAALTPPGRTGTESITGFSCTNCHDPHGVTSTTTSINLYRNLKGGLGDNDATWTKATNIGGGYVGGIGSTAQTGSAPTAAGNIWPIYRSGGGTYQNSYFTVDGKVLMSEFCAQCHGKWHEDIVGANGDEEADGTDWKRHPVNATLVGATPADELSKNGATIVDSDHYDKSYGGLAAGFKLPTADAGNTAGSYFDTAGAGKVFCLSCHFAHAGPYFDALRWSYQSSVSTGTQVGVSLQSDIGCQQCHNRGGVYGD